MTLACVSVGQGDAGLSAAMSDESPTPSGESEKPPGRTVKVRVIDEQGQPVAGVGIHAGVWTREPFPPNRDYTTDSGGVTVVELPGSFRILRLWARKGTYVPLFAQWWKERTPDDGEVPDEFTFQLERGTTIGGTIQNEDGEPIAGVSVEVMRQSGGFQAELSQRPIYGTWLAEGDAARITDESGRWTLDNVPEDAGNLQLKVSHPEYVNDTGWGQLQQKQGVTVKQLQNQTATIVMKRGGQLTGVVIDEATRARIRDALVIWGDDPYLQTGSQEVLTDDKGFYVVPPLDAQSMPLTVVAEGYAPQMKTVEVQQNDSSRRLRIDASFRMRPGHTIRIQFVDPDGHAVPEVHVGIVSWRGKKSLYNHRHPNVVDSKIPRLSNADGLYEWTWAPEDEVVYSFYKQDFREQRETVLVARDAVYEIRMLPE